MGPEEIRRAGDALHRAFLVDLEKLPPEAWGRPSDCAGWSVAQLVVHQTQVAELLADSLARARGGDAGPPPRAAEGVQAWRAWRTGEMTRRAAQPPGEVLAGYRAAADALERELDRLGGAPREARGWHPAGPQPLEFFPDQWLFELALHDWDLRVVDDPAAELRPECQAQFARTLPPRLGRSLGPTPDPAVAGRYRVELATAESPPFTWLATVAASGVEVTESAGADGADVTIRSDPAAFGLVMTNRRPAAGFAAAARWRADGDPARAEAFARAFKSY